MRGDFSGFPAAIIAVQVNAVGVFAGVQDEAIRVQAGQQKNFQLLRPMIFLDQFQRRKRPGGFVPVDAGRNIDASGRLGGGTRRTREMQGEQFLAADPVEEIRSPAALQRGRFDVAQHGVDVNRLAVVAAVVFTELLHAGNFTQKCEDAKNFQTRTAQTFMDWICVVS